MKKFIFVPILFAAFVVLTTQCFNKQSASAQKVVAAVPVKQTHKEATDTLLADAQAPLKPLTFKALNSTQALAFLTATNLDSLFIKDYPDNGFYGEDRYRIEFLMATCRRDETDPTLYHVTGKIGIKKQLRLIRVLFG